MRMPARPFFALASAACGVLMPSPAQACSMTFFTAVRSARLAFFIGTASADTVHAGKGDVKYTVAGGHLGPAGDRPIFGQIVSVERVTGIDRSTLPEQLSQVLLLPWDYGADCVPTPLMRSARWISPGTRGIYRGTLRAQSQWVNGVPTLDVFTPEQEPYPSGPDGRGISRRFRLADSSLSIDELFPVLHLLPDHRALRDSAERTVEPLLTWARANPTLARRSPMAEAVSFATYAVRNERVRNAASPVLGTYRFVVSIAGDTDRVFYLRTEARPDGEWNVTRSRQGNLDPTEVAPMQGYYITAATRQALAALPLDCIDRQIEREGYLAVAAVQPVIGADGLEWKGMIEFSLISRALPGDAALTPYARAWDADYARRYREGLPEEAAARFTNQSGGPMRVKLDVVLDDGRRLALRGERLSPAVMRCTSD